MDRKNRSFEKKDTTSSSGDQPSIQQKFTFTKEARNFQSSDPTHQFLTEMKNKYSIAGLNSKFDDSSSISDTHPENSEQEVLRRQLIKEREEFLSREDYKVYEAQSKQMGECEAKFNRASEILPEAFEKLGNPSLQQEWEDTISEYSESHEYLNWSRSTINSKFERARHAFASTEITVRSEKKDESQTTAKEILERYIGYGQTLKEFEGGSRLELRIQVSEEIDILNAQIKNFNDNNQGGEKIPELEHADEIADGVELNYYEKFDSADYPEMFVTRPNTSNNDAQDS